MPFWEQIEIQTTGLSWFFFYIHLLSFLCHYSSPSRHLTKVLPKYLLIAKHPSAALFTLFFCGAGYAKSLIKELQNNVNTQDITLSGAISKCNLVPTHSCPSSHICGDAFLPFNHQFSVCHLHVCVHFSILVWRTRYYTKGHFFGCMSAM